MIFLTVSWTLLTSKINTNDETRFPATPCDADGRDLADGTSPPLRQPQSNDDWGCFESRVRFELAEHFYVHDEASATSIDRILDIWSADKLADSSAAPFDDHRDLYAAIDASEHGDVPWESFNVSYNGPSQSRDVPKWMTTKHEIWYRDPHEVAQQMIANPKFKGRFDYTPYREFRSGKRRWADFMSGNWAWKQAVCHLQPLDCLNSKSYDKSRISLAKTLQHMAQCLSQLS